MYSDSSMEQTKRDDQRQISQTPSSSGGEGGIFGNASAAIGDVSASIGGASTTGDVYTTTTQGGLVYKKGFEWWQVGLVVAVVLAFTFKKGR